MTRNYCFTARLGDSGAPVVATVPIRMAGDVDEMDWEVEAERAWQEWVISQVRGDFCAVPETLQGASHDRCGELSVP